MVHPLYLPNLVPYYLFASGSQKGVRGLKFDSDIELK